MLEYKIAVYDGSSNSSDPQNIGNAYVEFSTLQQKSGQEVELELEHTVTFKVLKPLQAVQKLMFLSFRVGSFAQQNTRGERELRYRFFISALVRLSAWSF